MPVSRLFFIILLFTLVAISFSTLSSPFRETLQGRWSDTLLTALACQRLRLKCNQISPGHPFPLSCSGYVVVYSWGMPARTLRSQRTSRRHGKPVSGGRPGFPKGRLIWSATAAPFYQRCTPCRCRRGRCCGRRST